MYTIGYWLGRIRGWLRDMQLDFRQGSREGFGYGLAPESLKCCEIEEGSLAHVLQEATMNLSRSMADLWTKAPTKAEKG